MVIRLSLLEKIWREFMQPKSIIIIGAGIAGLSAGCYAQMNGYNSRIFELHSQPGGLCTAWQRKGYTFDGCIHWLVGSSEGGLFNNIWQELGAFQGRKFINHDEFMRVNHLDGRTFILYTNIDRLEKHMLELSPADARLIRQLCRDVRKLAGMKSFGDKPREVMKPLEALALIPAMLPVMGLMKKYGSMTMKELAAQFSDPLLSKSFSMMFDLDDFPALGFLMTIGYMHNENAGYPVGGSLEFSHAIEKRYIDLGGQIQYRARVAKILVENGRAVGVKLEDGSEYRADVVISAADGHATIFDMLDGKYVDDEIKSNYQNMPIFQPIIQVSLGVNRDLSDTPPVVLYLLEQPISIAGEPRRSLGVKHFVYDPGMAPAGKSVVEVMYSSNHVYWKQLSSDPERYESEKKQVALTIIQQLEILHPGISEQIEAVDVSTPLTYERYTGNWQGSMEGWLLTTKTMGKMMSGGSMKKTLPGLENFHMIGQWVEPGGGVPTAANSARSLMQILCHKDGKAFKVSTV
jgi:phytoene dehydrogenase-like protein